MNANGHITPHKSISYTIKEWKQIFFIIMYNFLDNIFKYLYFRITKKEHTQFLHYYKNHLEKSISRITVKGI
jgi:hypothetical protein